MNYKDFLAAMQTIESDRNINKDIVKAALEEALLKAYRKHIEIPDAYVRVDVNETTGDIHVYRQFKIVEEVEDPELEVTLEEARERDQDLQLDDMFEIEASLAELGRPAALLAKNVLKQKIREAEKQGVYDEYINQLGEMVIGSIETVEEKFIIVNLGKTLALLPKASQIPNERYYEGEKIRVVITSVNRDTKGAQVLVSRADATLVRRLFEKEVPEIYQGIVEIKAIAREAGERTKIAVYSTKEDVDPIGACIGLRGSRVHVVIEELKGEKIDIFEWSDNMDELIKNALAPAQVVAVMPATNQKGLLVVVPDDQLSLAIGKKGKNARLAVRLTGQKIDIKTVTELEEQGIDYQQLAMAYQAEQKAAQLAKEAEKYANEHMGAVEVTETETGAVEIEEIPVEVEPVVENQPEVMEEVPVEEEPPVVEEKSEPVVKRVKKPLKDRSTEYVSKFEKLADASKATDKKEKDARAARKKKLDAENEERKLRASELRKEKDYEIKPEYTDEELEAIRLRDEEEKAKSWIEDEIDFDEFDEYYDFEEK